MYTQQGGRGVKNWQCTALEMQSPEELQGAVRDAQEHLAYGGEVPGSFYNTLFPASMTAGKTAIMANLFNDTAPITAQSALQFWVEDPQHRPMGSHGLVVGAFMKIPDGETLERFRMKGNTRFRFGFITDVFVADADTFRMNVFPRPPAPEQEGRGPQSYVATAFHYTIWDKVDSVPWPADGTAV